MVIRQAQISDIPYILSMCVKMHKESNFSTMNYSERVMESVLTQLISSRQYVGLSTKESKITGMFLGYKQQSFFGTDSIASDLLLYVLPEYRGTSAATCLIKGFTDWAESQPEVKQIRPGISTGTTGEKAIGLYERLGYVRTGVTFMKEN